MIQPGLIMRHIQNYKKMNMLISKGMKIQRDNANIDLIY